VWEDRAAMHHAHLTEAINGGSLAASRALEGLQSSGISSAQALASIDRMINAQAYVMAADDIFYASAVIFLILLPMLWMTSPRKSAAAAAGAAGAH